MILHLVFFKFNEPFQWCDDEVIDAEASTRQHPLHIEEIKGWVCGRNVSQRKRAVDFTAVGLFESQETLSVFLNHPNHLQGVVKWQKIATWQVVDVEVGSDTTLFYGLLNKWVAKGLTPVDELKVS